MSNINLGDFDVDLEYLNLLTENENNSRSLTFTSKKYGVFMPYFDEQGYGVIFGLSNIYPNVISHLDENYKDLKLETQVGLSNKRIYYNIHGEKNDICFNTYHSIKHIPAFRGEKKEKIKSALFNQDLFLQTTHIDVNSDITKVDLPQYLKNVNLKLTLDNHSIQDENKRRVRLGRISNTNISLKSSTKVSKNNWLGLSLSKDNQECINDELGKAIDGYEYDYKVKAKSNIDSQDTYGYISSNYSYYKSLKNDSIFKTKLNYKQLLGNKYPIYKALTLGGDNSIRGYRDGELATSEKLIQVSFELSLPMIKKFKIFKFKDSIIYGKLNGNMFIDYGDNLDGILGNDSAKLKELNNLLNKRGSGYGVGLGIGLTPFIEKNSNKAPLLPPIRLEVAKSKLNDSLIHFYLDDHDFS